MTGPRVSRRLTATGRPGSEPLTFARRAVHASGRGPVTIAAMAATPSRSPHGGAPVGRGHRGDRIAELIERLSATVEGRNRDYDAALDVADEPIGREYPGPPAGCGHIRLVR